jgi:predicted small lipoprotein YifL
MKAPMTGVLARVVILFAALSALCLLLAGCGSEGPAPWPASAEAVSKTSAVAPHGVFGHGPEAGRGIAARPGQGQRDRHLGPGRVLRRLDRPG